MEIKAINIKQKEYIGGRNDYRKFEDENDTYIYMFKALKNEVETL